MDRTLNTAKLNIRVALSITANDKELLENLSNKENMTDVYEFLTSVSGGYEKRDLDDFLRQNMGSLTALTDEELKDVSGGVKLSMGKRISMLLIPLIVTINGTLLESYSFGGISSEEVDSRGTDLSPQKDVYKPKIKKKIIDVPYINQNMVVYGCEAVSMTMLLRYYGYDISERDFTNKYLTRKDWSISKNGRVYGPDPHAAYPGNPYIQSGLNCGFGAYAPCIAKSANKLLKSSLKAKVTTGMELSDIITRYIDNNIPVLIWATMDMQESKFAMSWIVNYVDENSPCKIGDTFTWHAGEHCLVLVGYDEKNYYFNDPYKNHGLIGYDKSLVQKRFKEMGKQSLIIE